MAVGDTKLVGILPDSRARESKGVVRGDGVNWVRVYCANCGKFYGRVPEQTCTFTCWLCDPCSDKWGEQFGVLTSPDEAFWKHVESIMLEEYGRILSKEEIQMLAEQSGSLPKLIREGK